MSSNPPLRFSHSHHLLSVKGCESGLDVLAFEGDEALSKPFSYRIEFTSGNHAISKEMMLMKPGSLTLQAPVDQGYGIKIQQPVRVIQGVVTGLERLGTSKDETRYAVTLEPRLALLDRSHQNAIYQDMSVPQIVEKILRERHNMRGQDFLFSLTREYPRREQVMQYGENDLHFITRLLGEVGIWFRFTTDTRLNIDVVEFYDSQQEYEKGLTLQSAPWYQRFGLDHNQQLLDAMLPWYGVANNRLIRDPANEALKQKLSALANSAPNSDQRAMLAKPGYDQLKAWLMMARPDKADGAFYAQTMKTVQPVRMGISAGLWQSLSPDLWAFYISGLPAQPQWKITPDAQLVRQSRQVLLQQIGRRNAESTLYENMLKSVRRNFADVSLEDMTGGTDARRLFTTDEAVPGMFTRQAWEGGIQQAIEKAANSRRDEIDWVLSDSQKAVSADLSPEALKVRLTQRYFTDFAGSWLSFLNSLQLNPANNIADVTDQLTLMSDVRQSPLIALMNTLAWQGQTGQQSEGLSDSLIKSAKDLVGGKDKPAIDQSALGPQGPLDDTFGPLLQLLGKNKGSNVMSADNSLSLQTYLTRITRVRLRLQQVASASDPQEMMQTLAQTVFQGKSVDLTDTQQYGNLISASLGEEWGGFGSTMFVQPLTQAWETVLQPAAASLNDKWNRSVVANWHTAFDGRFPFAASKSDASLPMLAEFVRKDSGRIERFLTTELGGVLHKEGSSGICRYDITTIRLVNGDRSVSIMPEQLCRSAERGCVIMRVDAPGINQVFCLSMAPKESWFIRREQQGVKENAIMTENHFFLAVDCLA